MANDQDVIASVVESHEDGQLDAEVGQDEGTNSEESSTIEESVPMLNLFGNRPLAGLLGQQKCLDAWHRSPTHQELHPSVELAPSVF